MVGGIAKLDSPNVFTCCGCLDRLCLLLDLFESDGSGSIFVQETRFDGMSITGE